MLSYDPSHDEGMLYLFDASGRASAKNELLEDIPRLVTEAGDAIAVQEFYESDPPPMNWSTAYDQEKEDRTWQANVTSPRRSSPNSAR